MIERLKQLRELWGWSQAFVAAMLRVSRSSISRWERGTSTPQLTNQEKIEALVRSLEQARRATPQDEPPDVEVRVGGDAISGDKVISGDDVAGDVITTSSGTTYIIKESIVIVVTDADAVQDLLPSET